MIQIDLLKKAITITTKDKILDYKSKIFPSRKPIKTNTHQSAKVKESAVIVLLYPKNDTFHFVLTQRPAYPGTHGGQISFPGGKREKEDHDLTHTALRETWEEIGVRLSENQIISSLQPLYIPPSNFMVYPFLALSIYPLDFTKDDFEVETILEIPCDLLHTKNIKNGSINSSSNLQMKISYYELNNSVVWGATASILAELHAILDTYYKLESENT